MAHLTIRNIGPIKGVDIELKRINVFIGPQSSGKSTIAKIVGFCQWLEKDCVLRQSIAHVDVEFVEKCLIRYYNISEYFSDDSEFSYSGNALDISFHDRKISLQINKGFSDLAISKNAYIPSERNILSVPGIFTTKMPDNYLLEFIDDWQQIRTHYNADAKIKMLGLGGSYYYDSREDSDKLLLDDGKMIHMSQASSGMQSVTPLCVYIDYLTQWVYSHEENRSAQTKKRRRDAAISKALSDLKVENSPLYESLLNMYAKPETPDVSERLLSLASNIAHGKEKESEITQEDVWVFQTLRKLLEYDARMIHPSFSNLVIEEPEQNLFPDTQVKLLYYILERFDHKRDSLILTTHSPYILYALNNCMIASFVGEDDREAVKEFTDVPESAWIDPRSINVMELDNGEIRNSTAIQDERGLIRGNYFDRVMHNVMADFNALLNFSRLK